MKMKRRRRTTTTTTTTTTHTTNMAITRTVVSIPTMKIRNYKKLGADVYFGGRNSIGVNTGNAWKLIFLALLTHANTEAIATCGL